MKGDTKTMIYLSPELLEKINDYRHANKIDSRNAAIIQLIEKGLESAK